MTDRRVAAVDIGTNTVRLLVAEARAPGLPGHGPLVELDRRREVVRLGEGVDATGRFSEAALDRTLATLTTFGEALRSWRPDAVGVVATSATRDAVNRDEFLDSVELALGSRPEVISGDREARLSFAGTVSAFGGDVPTVVVDLGGGSTEFVYGTTTVGYAVSVDIGSVRLTERVLGEGPHDAVALDRARAHVDALFAAVRLPAVPERTIGVAGTFTSLAALHLGLEGYDGEVVHGTTVSLEGLTSLCGRLAEMTTGEIAALGSVDPRRAGVLTAGAIIAERSLVAVGVDAVVVSEADLLDGIALWAAGLVR